MTSWRDEATEQAQSDLDGLLNAVLPFVEQTLARHGDFYPFGAVVRSGGEYAMASPEPAGDGEGTAQSMLASLYAGVRQDAEDLRAVAFAINVETDESDAVLVELEHIEGQTIDVLVPYELDQAGGGDQGDAGTDDAGNEDGNTVRFGTPTADAAEPRVWPTT